MPDILEIPVEVLSTEVVGYAMKIECKVGDQVITFHYVATFKELEEREKIEEEADE